MLHETADLVVKWGRVGHGGGDHVSRTIDCDRAEKGHERAAQWTRSDLAYLVLRITSQAAYSGLNTANSGVHVTLQG